jgi:BirA family biotin operon repressor/biotin-[acetyl-CoA-carboxylase] ligase
MDFLDSGKIANRFEYVESTGSTNTDLVAQATASPMEYPHLSVLVAGSQTAGRGRTGRAWVSPSGKSLSISVLVRPSWTPEPLGWLPLVAGVSMRAAIAEVLPEKVVTLKWPNDVQVGGLKISGILAELLPGLSGVVIGAGLNLTLSKAELPIEAATSLLLEGAEVTADDILSRYLNHLKKLTETFDGVPDLVRAACSTIGLPVKAILPSDEEVHGTAVGIDETGRLLIQVGSSEQLFAVSAGDVTHLRHN